MMVRFMPFPCWWHVPLKRLPAFFIFVFLHVPSLCLEHGWWWCSCCLALASVAENPWSLEGSVWVRGSSPKSLSSLGSILEAYNEAVTSSSGSGKSTAALWVTDHIAHRCGEWKGVVLEEIPAHSFHHRVTLEWDEEWWARIHLRWT